MAYGCETEEIKVPIPAVNTHRDKPLVSNHSAADDRSNNKQLRTSNAAAAVAAAAAAAAAGDACSARPTPAITLSNEFQCNVRLSS